MENWLLGLGHLADWQVVAALIMGTALGIVVGAMPGLSGPTGLALMIPFTYILSPIVSSVLIIYGENVAHNPWPFGVFIVAIMVVAYWRRRQLFESISLVVANLGVGLGLPILWDDLKTYQQMRIINFLDPGAEGEALAPLAGNGHVHTGTVEVRRVDERLLEPGLRHAGAQIRVPDVQPPAENRADVVTEMTAALGSKT